MHYNITRGLKES